MARKRAAYGVFRPSNRLILLGAGATRGASFGFVPEARPPLNRDFFTQLQHITSKHDVLARQVIADVIDLFDSNFTITLEDYFTQLEFLAMNSQLASDKEAAAVARDVAAKRDRLMAALSAVLEASTARAISSSGRGCEFHRRLVQQLRPRDTVISFNYDCVFDDALRRDGEQKWSARWGYCFPRRYSIAGAAEWNPTTPAASLARTIYYLKLHGSLNWQLPSGASNQIVVKKRLHSQRGTPRFSIIPPEWNKSARDEPVYNLLWRRALRAVRVADEVAIVGFSFTPTDLHVESLFRIAMANSSLRTLVIANPSSEDRERIRKVFARPLARNRAIVRQYESLEAFVDAYPQCFN